MMSQNSQFQLQQFLPYLLNQIAEQTSAEFRHIYNARYGLLRTEWRVLFHLGCYGEMMAKDICARARLHKTKVSRAVAALEKRRFLKRTVVDADRRHEILVLTAAGRTAFNDLQQVAENYSQTLEARFGKAEIQTLRTILLAILDGDSTCAVKAPGSQQQNVQRGEEK